MLCSELPTQKNLSQESLSFRMAAPARMIIPLWLEIHLKTHKNFIGGRLQYSFQASAAPVRE
jgi:hypothetical protein